MLRRFLPIAVVLVIGLTLNPAMAQPADSAELPSEEPTPAPSEHGAAHQPAPSPTAAAPAQAPAHKAQPQPHERPGRHLHDGFYLRINLGLGYLGTVGTSDNSDKDLVVRGAGASFDLLLGGTPLPGLTIGGGMMSDTAPSPKTKGAGSNGVITLTSIDTPLVQNLFGVFVDGFPNPRQGLHFGGLLGFASLAFANTAKDEDDSATGFGAAIWAGYDFWVSDNWSLGAMLRLTGSLSNRTAKANNSEFSESHRTGSIALLFSVLYH